MSHETLARNVSFRVNFRALVDGIYLLWEELGYKKPKSCLLSQVKRGPRKRLNSISIFITKISYCDGPGNYEGRVLPIFNYSNNQSVNKHYYGSHTVNLRHLEGILHVPFRSRRKKLLI